MVICIVFICKLYLLSRFKIKVDTQIIKTWYYTTSMINSVWNMAYISNIIRIPYKISAWLLTQINRSTITGSVNG